MGKAPSKTRANDFTSPFSKIHWVDGIEKGKLIAGFTGKPMLLLIMRSWCPTCKFLAPKYHQSEDVQFLSKYFVMVRCMDNKELDTEYAPDGAYIPRIIFLQSDGQMMNDFRNEINPKGETKYFYPRPEDLAFTMRKVLASFYAKSQNNWATSFFQKSN